MQRVIEKFDEVNRTICAAILFLAMSITFVDVIARGLINKPILGAFEVTELLLASLVFISMPLASRAGLHITIDLTSGMLPPAARNFSDRVMNLVSAAVLFGAGYLLWLRSMRLRDDGAITAVLHLPTWPVVVVMAAAIALMAGVHLLYAVTTIGPLNRETTSSAQDTHLPEQA